MAQRALKRRRLLDLEQKLENDIYGPDTSAPG